MRRYKRELKSAVAGYEVVFAPPKSVSLVWALGSPEVREWVAAIHRQAVRDTLTRLESDAAFTRRGDQGKAQVDVVGIAAAMFEHWDSRVGDPLLHTHVPISAKVKRAEDGKWTTLDGRTILAATVTMSEHYNSRIRDLLRDAGASWVCVPRDGIDMKRPTWELAGVPPELIQGFSRRAQQVERERARLIVEFRHRTGHEPSPKQLIELGVRAQYGTRAPKTGPKSLEEHQRRWRHEAVAMIGPETVAGLAQRVFSLAESWTPVDVEALAAQTRWVVSEHHSHFTRWNIEAEAHRQTAHLRVVPGGRDRLVAAVTDRVLTAQDTVSLEAPALVAEPERLRRESGESVFTVHHGRRYTTEQTLHEETALVRWGRDFGGTEISPLAVRRAFRGTRLNDGQRDLVAEFARSGRRLQLAIAPAGTGKTTAMRVFAQAWRTGGGGRVFAFGPSARAAAELAKAIGAKPHTLHALTHAVAQGVAEREFPFRRGDVLIIDEAAMAGTHTLHTAVGYAIERGADVRMVGDTAQLDAVEAGGVVRFFAAELGAVGLTEVVRFTDPDQAQASLRLRRGDPTGLDYYFDRGWVSTGSRETIRDRAQQEWRRDLEAGKQSLLIVPTIEDVTALNLQAREHRIAAGQVDQRASVPLHDGTHASIGDWIVTRHNNRHLPTTSGRDYVKNGDTWRVTATHPDGALDAQHVTTGAAIRLPADYRAEHVELAYAATVHRVQGMTSTGTAHTVVLAHATREQLYTSATRAVDVNRLYVETHHHLADQHGETPEPQRHEHVLSGILRHVGAETSATEQLRETFSTEDSLATLVMRHTYAARYGDEDRYAHLIAEHAPDAVEKPAEPALRATLRNAEDLGLPADQVLPAAVRRGSLDNAKDPAAVLQWRIQQTLDRRQPPPPDDLNSALPWLARPVPSLAQDQPDLLDYLRNLNTAIAQRTSELAGQTAVHRPAWSTAFGPRPADPQTAERWDYLLAWLPPTANPSPLPPTISLTRSATAPTARGLSPEPGKQSTPTGSLAPLPSPPDASPTKN